MYGYEKFHATYGHPPSSSCRRLGVVRFRSCYTRRLTPPPRLSLAPVFHGYKFQTKCSSLLPLPRQAFRTPPQLPFVPLVISLHSRPLHVPSSPFIVPFRRRYSSLLFPRSSPTNHPLRSFHPAPAQISSPEITQLEFFFFFP